MFFRFVESPMRGKGNSDVVIRTICRISVAMVWDETGRKKGHAKRAGAAGSELVVHKAKEKTRWAWARPRGIVSPVVYCLVTYTIRETSPTGFFIGERKKNTPYYRDVMRNENFDRSQISSNLRNFCLLQLLYICSVCIFLRICMCVYYIKYIYI